MLTIARETWGFLLASSPYLLFGLALAGIVKAMVPQAAIARLLGHDGFPGILRAAAVGIPLPVCSCGVVPLAVALRRQGASAPATMSFLITTPESGIDSILLSWGLLGPVMAVARPLASFASALLAGVFSRFAPAAPPNGAVASPACGGDGCGSDGCGGHAPPRSWTRRVVDETRELFDDLVFWMWIGIVTAGVLTALLPSDLAALGLGGGLGPMLLLLLVGIPLYVCASSSTPVAAALLLKGVSPGAALVFLLAGPATNAASLLLLHRTFGRRFIATYLAGIAVGALASGLALDALVAADGWSITPGLSPGSGEEGPGAWALGAALLFVALSVWRLAAGAGRAGWRDLRANLAALTGSR